MAYFLFDYIHLKLKKNTDRPILVLELLNCLQTCLL